MITDQPVVNQTKGARLRLDYLDGIRALAALYVVLHHVYIKFFLDDFWWADHVRRMPTVTNIFADGRWAVDVFIVLSGYCLMLPIARSSALELEGGFWQYIQRRARRILPAYYAALVFSITLLLLAHVVGHRAGVARDISGDLGLGAVLSHIFMVQNISSDWSGRIDAPMWSVATEWQIYFLLPILLLPVWRRGGNLAVLVLAFCLGVIPYFFHWSPLENVHSDLLGLFALGMVGAAINFASTASVFNNYRMWGLAAAFLIFTVLAVGSETEWYSEFSWQTDTLVGTATMCVLIWASGQLTEERASVVSPAIKLLQARWLVKTGHFSYSLYLVHSPILAICYILIRHTRLNLLLSFAALLLVGVPLSLGIAYVFYLMFERPFLKKRWSQAEHKPVADTVLAPAP